MGELSHVCQANPSSTLTMGDPQRVFKITCQEPGEKSARPSQTGTVPGQTDESVGDRRVYEAFKYLITFCSVTASPDPA